MGRVSLLYMVEVCTWDEVFSTYKKKANKNFVILYWYLFNKPDYQKNIADEMKRLIKLDEFKKNIPPSLTTQKNITKYFREMEERNLIGIKKTEDRKHYYQALSFFYIDPFCVKTPESNRRVIKSHYEEYSNNVNELKLETTNSSERGFFCRSDGTLLTLMKLRPFYRFPYLSFQSGKDNSVIPAQRIFQYYSRKPEEFMKMVSMRNVNHITLYELIKEGVKDVISLCDYRCGWIDVLPEYTEASDIEELQEMARQSYDEDEYDESEPSDSEMILMDFKAEMGFPSRLLNMSQVGSVLDEKTIDLIRDYNIKDWFGWSEGGEPPEEDFLRKKGITEKDCWNIVRNHAEEALYAIKTNLRLYREINNGNIHFDKKALVFRSC